MPDDRELTPAEVHRFDQATAEALVAWTAEVDGAVAAIRRNALPAGRPEAFVAIVEELQNRNAERSPEDRETGLTFLAAMALLKLAEKE